jgi:hypothetical protein
MLAGLLAGLLIVSCAQEPAPATGPPATVAAAADATLALLDDASRQELAYMRDDELISAHRGLGMTVRAQFDLWHDPGRLRDCKSRHPEDCSMEVVKALHSRLRAALPAAERAALEKLEAAMDRVRLPARDFEQTPLPEFVAFLQSAVDAQLPGSERFRIRYLPRDANEAVTLEGADRSMYELYKNMFTGLDFRKTPPDLTVAPYYRPLAGIPADGWLEVAYQTSQGLREETRELVRDAGAWQELWSRMNTASAPPSAPPVIDFTQHSALVIALGERPTSGYAVRAQAIGLHRSTAMVTVQERQPARHCMVAQMSSYPTSVFLVPRAASDIGYLEQIETSDCGG